MAGHEKEQKIVEPYLSQEPTIGQWLWALQDARVRTMRELEGLTPATVVPNLLGQYSRGFLAPFGPC